MRSDKELDDRPDRDKKAPQAKDLLTAAVEARRLFPRGGFEQLEPNALQVLAALAELGPSESVDLAEQLLLQRSTVRHALIELRDRGLVSEQMVAGDRRRRQQRLTARGRRLLGRYLQSLSGSP